MRFIFGKFPTKNKIFFFVALQKQLRKVAVYFWDAESNEQKNLNKCIAFECLYESKEKSEC